MRQRLTNLESEVVFWKRQARRLKNQGAKPAIWTARSGGVPLFLGGGQQINAGKTADDHRPDCGISTQVSKAPPMMPPLDMSIVPDSDQHEMVVVPSRADDEDEIYVEALTIKKHPAPILNRPGKGFFILESFGFKLSFSSASLNDNFNSLSI